ncbi:MAG: sulfotransferase domain-containing protein [Pseudomonadales bacterium]|nr:sulfotransferase domain-containing protein [Pseudomonadales bacterium]
MTIMGDTASKPEIKHYYRSALMDAKRWDNFQVRDDDIVITTSYKAGTTWMQGICAALVFQAPRPPVPQDELTPWLDANFGPIEEVLGLLESLQSRRYIKTHLPLDGIRFFDEIKYIFVGRDGKDVWMSMWNHWHNMNPEVIDEMNNNPDREGPPLVHAVDDIGPAFDEWLTRSAFPWENNGYPFWSHLHHAKTWWDFRQLPNILFVHYDDLLKDTDAEMRRISAYLDIPVNEEIWPSLLEAVSFTSMKKDAATMGPGATQGVWKDSSNFFHKGTNKRWQGVLGEEQIKAYDDLALRELGPELAQWLEFGGRID